MLLGGVEGGALCCDLFLLGRLLISNFETEGWWFLEWARQWGLAQLPAQLLDQGCC